VGAWKKIKVTVYLRGAAVLALSEFVDEFVDPDNYARYLPILGEWGRPVYVQRNAPCLADLGAPTLPCQEVSDAELAELAANSDCVLRF
jgi:hypothetical protein